MSASLKAPSLADIGYKLWGPRWAEPMAAALQITDKEVIEWDAKPEKIRPHLEDQLKAIAANRVKEIHRLVAQLDATGLKRGTTMDGIAVPSAESIKSYGAAPEPLPEAGGFLGDISSIEGYHPQPSIPTV